MSAQPCARRAPLRFLSRSLWLTPLLALALAACGGNSSSDDDTGGGNPPTLTRVEVTPSAPTLSAGTQQQFVAMAIFSDNSRQVATSTVTWASSNTAVATISNTAGSNGLALSLRAGTTTISAALNGVTGSTTLTVSASALTALAITPPNPSIANGSTQQFAATATFSDGSTQDVTAATTFSSSNVTVATISNTAGSNGLARALAAGSTTIAAAYQGRNASTGLTVTAATAASISVTPTNASIAGGSTQQYTATAILTDGTTQNVTTSATWTSSDTTVASISNDAGSNGLARALSVGSTTITAAALGASGSTTLNVTPAILTALAVTPADPSIANGLSQRFTATGTYADGRTQDLTGQVTWSSSNAATATISNAPGSEGLAQSLAVGTTTITAVLGDVTASTGLTVTAAAIATIELTPANATIPRGRTQQYTATGIYTDSTTRDLTGSVTWSSSDPAIANISNAAGSRGLAATNTPGAVTISATQDGVTGSTGLVVGDAVLVSISVTPANPSLPLGFSRQFTAMGVFSDNSRLDITTSVTWNSTSVAVATISNASGSQGVATGVSTGTTTISATQNAIVGSATLTVSNATLTTINVQPAAPSIPLGLSQQFTATGTFSDTTTLPLTTQVTWTSGTPTVATISNADGSRGLASSLTTGSTVITATSGAVSGNTTLTVTGATVTAIAVTPPDASVPAGFTQQYRADATLSDGSTQDLTGNVTWSSSDTTIATISNAAGSRGLASAARVGTVTIAATLQGVTGSTTLTVTAATLSSIAVTPADLSLPLGLQQQYQATGRYSDLSLRDLTGSVTWASSNAAVATISNAAGSTGLASTVAAGTTTISAALDTISGSTSLTVTAVALQSITVTPADSSAPVGTNVPFTATGRYSDSSTQNLTQSVTWSSSQPVTADISNSPGTQGVAIARAAGTVRIAAVDPATGVRGETGLTVTGATLNSIVITPAAALTGASVPAGYERQFVAMGLYSDGQRDITAQANWSTFEVNVATVLNEGVEKGLVVGNTPGTTNLVANLGGVSGTFALTVSNATLNSIAVTPATATIARNATQQYQATGTFSDGLVLPFTQQVGWSSSNEAIVTISNAAGSQGLATAAPLRIGTVTITAQNRTVTGTASLTVRLN